MRALSSAITSALFAGVLAAGGCIFSTGSDDPVGPPSPPARGDPEGLFEYFGIVYSDPTRDIDGYAQCLHSDYTFTFTNADAQEMREGDPTFPGFWTSEEDVAATANMFANAISIHLELVLADSLPPEPCDPGDPGGSQCRVYVVEVILSVEVEIPGQPEHTTYIVAGYANFVVTQDEFDPDLWVIYNILDRTNEIGSAPAPALPRPGQAGPALTEATTWGALRALFDPPTPLRH